MNRDLLEQTKPFKAIAAMSLNRVIGRGNEIPWHLPEDFKWFKQKTSGQIIIMGRKTFESIGRPLPNRTTYVLSRRKVEIPNVRVFGSLEEIPVEGETRQLFICGGAEIYAEALPYCQELYLTVIERLVEGDAFFPAPENFFEIKETLRVTDDFKILHFRHRHSTC